MAANLSMQQNKLIGSILIVVGTCIGAGILALPMVSAQAGFFSSALLMLGVWALMTVTGLITIEVNLSCPDSSNSFSTMARSTLGKVGQFVTWGALLLLLYSILAAYSSGASILLKDLLHSALDITLPNWSYAILFIGVLGSAVFSGTSVVDYANRFLITAKGLLLISSLALLLPHVDLSNIYNHSSLYANKYLGMAAPIFLCAFGFQMIIPSLRNYLGAGDKRKELRFIILCGTLAPLIIYLMWLLVTLGIVPLHGNSNSFDTIKVGGNSIDNLVESISAIVHNKWVTAATSGFFNISMTTSFLGVSLSLFDFLADGCKRPNNRIGRLQTAIMTFTPPLLFALYYPKGFVMALGYASIFIAILLVILPAMMAYKLRQNKELLVAHKLLLSRTLLIGTIFAGFIFIILQIMEKFGLY